MSLTYDTPAGKLVYDASPEVTYDPARGASSAGDPRIAYNGPHRVQSSGMGFGSTRRMLDVDRPIRHPWLTVDLAKQELAIGEYQADRVQCAMDTVE